MSKEQKENDLMREFADTVFEVFDYDHIEEVFDFLLYKASGNLDGSDICDNHFGGIVFTTNTLRRMFRQLYDAHKGLKEFEVRTAPATPQKK